MNNMSKAGASRTIEAFTLMVLAMMVGASADPNPWPRGGDGPSDYLGCGGTVPPPDVPLPSDCPTDGPPFGPSPSAAQSTNPVRFLDGTVVEKVVDLSLPSLGDLRWSHGRSYSGRENGLLPNSNHGCGWSADELPRFIEPVWWRDGSKDAAIDEYSTNPPPNQNDPPDQIRLAVNTQRCIVFTYDGNGSFAGPPDYPATVELVYVGDPSQAANRRLKLTDLRTGIQSFFYDYLMDGPTSVGGFLFGIGHPRLGRLERVVDVHGNEIRYTWHSSEKGHLMKAEIFPADSQPQSDPLYTVKYEYCVGAYWAYAHISRISVFGGSIETGTRIAQADYAYNDNDLFAEFTVATEGSLYDGLPCDADTGSWQELVMVVVRQADDNDLDELGKPNLRIARTTMYRYTDGRLKGVFDTNAIETIFRKGSGAPLAVSVDGRDTLAIATDLLAQPDDWSVGGSPLNGYASRWFGYYYFTSNDPEDYPGLNPDEFLDYHYSEFKNVRTETVNACTSCGGSEPRGAYDLAYFKARNIPADPGPNDLYRAVVMDRPDGAREIYKLNKDGIILKWKMLANKNNTSSATWYRTYEYCTTAGAGYGRLLRQYEPSAHDASGNVTSTGLCYVYDYTTTDANDVPFTDGQCRLLCKALRNGSSGDIHLLEKYEYFSPANGPGVYRVKKVRRFSTDQSLSYPASTDASYYSIGSVPAGNTGFAALTGDSVTEYTYDYDSGVLTHSSIIVTNPGSTQNGPGGTSTTDSYYDDRGLLRWTQDPEGYINFYCYGDYGQLTLKAIDVDPNLPASITGDSRYTAAPDGPARSSTLGTPLNLKTTYDYDLLQRLTARTEPDGQNGLVNRWFYYCNNAFQVDADDAYQTTAEVHECRAVHGSGPYYAYEPFRVAKYDTAGRLTADLLVKTKDTQGQDQRVDCRISDITGFADSQLAAKTSYSYDATGRLSWLRQYHTPIVSDAETTPDTANYYLTSYTYNYPKNGEGETVTTTRRIGDTQLQWQRTQSDVLGRPETVEMAVNTATPKVVGSFAYDVDPGTGAHVNAYGARMPVREKRYVDDNSADVYPTDYTYDWRGRLIVVAPPDVSATAPDMSSSPYTLNKYDNQNRLIATGTYRRTATLAATSDPTDDTLDGRLTLDETLFDCRGRVYRSLRHQIASDGSDGGSLRSDTYYDRRNLPVAVVRAGAGVSTTCYDGAGRRACTIQACSLPSPAYNNGAFVPPTASQTIAEKVQYDLDKAGRVTKQTRYELRHDDDGSGSMTRSYVYSWYDANSGLLTAQANYGTNGTTNVWADAAAPTYDSSTIPARGDSILLTSYTYNSAGQLEETTDPKGIVTHKTYDGLGRVTQAIEDSGTGKLNRTTSYAYDGNGSVTKLTANNSGSQPDQVTAYVYGDPINSRLVTKICYPIAATGVPSTQPSDVDKIAFTYNYDGSPATRTDQNGTVLTYTYDPLGRRTLENVTTFGSGVDQGDRATKAVGYDYDPTGRLHAVATYEVADASGTSAVHQVTYAYNGLGQPASETTHIDPDGTGPLNALPDKTVGYTYSTLDTTHFYSRLTGLTYPNERTIGYAYSEAHWDSNWVLQSQIDDAFSRVGQITSGSTLASYSFAGLNRMVSRNHETMYQRLATVLAQSDGSNPAVYSGYDRFGRTVNKGHVSYMDEILRWTDGSVLAGTHYGYDPNGNRTFDEPVLLPEHARFFTYDNLNRLDQSDMGPLNTAKSALAGAPYGSPRTVDPSYDLLGNFTHSQVNQYVEDRNHSADNQITTRTAASPVSQSYRYAQEDFAGTNPLSNWTPLSGTAWSISSGHAQVDTCVSDGTLGHKALMILKTLNSLTSIRNTVTITFPDNNADTYAGIVFAYQDANNYWLFLVKRYADASGMEGTWWQVSGGVLSQVGSGLSYLTTQSTVTVSLLVQGGYARATLGSAEVTVDGSFAPGAVGLFASRTGIQFDDFLVSPVDWPTPASPTWQAYNGQYTQAGGTGTLTPSLTASETDPLCLAVREGSYGDNYDIEAHLQGQNVGVAFRIKDKLNYTFVAQRPDDGFYSIDVIRVTHGQPHWVFSYGRLVSGQAIDPKHIHIRVNGANLGVWVDDGGTWKQMVFNPTSNGYLGLSEPCGQVGLAAGMPTNGLPTDPAVCDYLRIGTDSNADHSLADGETWINETFLTSVTPTYDAAGNLTYDGIFRYTYDAWNHLVRVQRPGTTTPQTIAEYAYDGLGRRYRKVVTGSGDRNRTDYFYYDNQWRLLEMRNDQDQATRQFVWGSRYIDELICMDVDTDGDGDCADFDEPGVYGYDRYRYFQDANWNVTAIWDEHGGAQLQRDEFAGSLRERYEYDAYGQARIYKGWDDVAAGESLQVIGESQIRNPIRYAGYFFDDETGLYHVRHRMYSPRLQRMLQRDPAGYIDGMSLYGYAGSSPFACTDPMGLSWFSHLVLMMDGIDTPETNAAFDNAFAKANWDSTNGTLNLVGYNMELPNGQTGFDCQAQRQAECRARCVLDLTLNTVVNPSPLPLHVFQPGPLVTFPAWDDVAPLGWQVFVNFASRPFSNGHEWVTFPVYSYVGPGMGIAGEGGYNAGGSVDKWGNRIGAALKWALFLKGFNDCINKCSKVK